MLKSNDDKIPSCLGNPDLFDVNAAECVGGFDLAYDDGHGGRVRQRCDYVGTCSEMVQKRQQQKLIPPSSLVRPHTAFSQNYTPKPQLPQGPAAVPPGPRPWAPVAPYAQPPSNFHPSVGMQQMMPVNFSIPQYLSVREPVTSGGVMKRLSWEVFRSMGKSIGHTLSNFFDSEAFGFKHPPPPRNPEDGGHR